MRRRTVYIGLLLAAGLSMGAGIYGDVSTIQGKVFYERPAEGPVRVEVFDRPQFAPRPLYSAVVSDSDSYEATVLSGTYYVRAYIDVNRNGAWDEGEPVGFYRQGRGIVILPLASKLGIDIKIEEGKRGVREEEKK